MVGATATGVSVIIPTYNGERHLPATLSSLTASGAHPAEVLVVDDGSTDRTLAVADAYTGRLPLRILRPRPRRSWMAMTNLGLEEASSPWCAILHQDDLWLPGRGDHIAAPADDQAAVVAMDATFVDGRGRRIGSWRLPRAATGGTGAHPAVAPLLWVQNWVPVPAATFRTADARAVGGLDEDLWYTADWDLWLNLAREGGVRCTPRAGAAFRVHGSSQTVTGSRDLAGFRAQMETVQARHAWALELAERPEVLRRAGELSTETNVALAGLLHRQQVDVTAWVRAWRSAGRRGTAAYLRHSALGSRLGARLRSAVEGQLRVAAAP